MTTIGAQLFKDDDRTPIYAIRGRGGPVTADSPPWLRALAGFDKPKASKTDEEKGECEG